MGRERERSMRQSGRYAESNVNPNMVGQMLHSAQRMHMTSGPGMSQLQGRSDSFRPDDEHQYTSSNLEAQWQWDRNGSRGPPSSHGYIEGQLNASRSPFQGKWSDSRQSLERKIHPDSENMTRQKEVNARYDDSALPQTFEGLEQKFVDDISKLAKDQYDAEDAENARHVQRLTEINTQYQEKLSAMRIRQAADRDDFLRKESQSRLHEYQQGKMNSYNKPISVPSDYIGYPISGGSTIKLMHGKTKYRLHSHDVPYGSGSGQQSVTGFPNVDDSNSYWIVRPVPDTSVKQGDVIKHGTILRIQHMRTRKWLHSHLHASPISQNLEISCFGGDDQSDTGDYWRLEIEGGGKIWKQDQNIRLQHVDTGGYLHSHNKKYNRIAGGQQEVCGVREKRADNIWQASEGVYLPVNGGASGK